MISSQKWDTESEDGWNIIKRKKKIQNFVPKHKEIIQNKNTSNNNETHYNRFVCNFIKDGDIDILSSTSDETNFNLENISISNNHNITEESEIIKDKLIDTNTNDLVFSNSTLKDTEVLQLSKSFERPNHDTFKKKIKSSCKSKKKSIKYCIRKPFFLAQMSSLWLRISFYTKKFGIRQNHSNNDHQLNFEEILVIFVIFFFLSLGVWKFFNLIMIVLFKNFSFISSKEKGLSDSKMSSKIITTFNWEIDLKNIQTYKKMCIGTDDDNTITTFTSSSISEDLPDDNKDIVSFESKLYISTVPIKYRTTSKQIKNTWKPQGKYLIDFDTQSIYKIDTISIMLNFYKKLIRGSKTHYDQIKLLFEKEINKDVKRWSVLKNHVETIRNIAKENIKTINWKKNFWID